MWSLAVLQKLVGFSTLTVSVANSLFEKGRDFYHRRGLIFLCEYCLDFHHRRNPRARACIFTGQHPK